jgi:hypothetical protein
MQHIDEHTIELYVFGSELVQERRAEIEAHFRECHGCRALAEQMKTFYQRAEEGYDPKPAPEKEVSKAVARSHRHMAPYYEPFAPAVPYRPATLAGRFTYFIRRHPVATGAAGFALVGVLLAGIFIGRGLNGSFTRIDKNPAYTEYDVNSNMICVYNKEDSLLWKKKSDESLAYVRKEENINDRKFTILTDLDNDGKKEILTTVGTSEDLLQNQKSLKVFDYDKTFRIKITVPETIKYKSQSFDPTNNLGLIIAEDLDGDGKPEIFTTTSSLRSPSALVRLNSRLQVIGEYLHYGSIMGAYFTDLNADGRKELVICGYDDLGDSVDNENSSPFIAVLDPLKIIGKGRATNWQGLEDIPSSDAELFYLQLPRSSIDRYLHQTPQIVRMTKESNNRLRFRLMTVIESSIIEFYYYFDSSMIIKEVSTSDGSSRFYNSLVESGELKGRIDSTYLNNLKNGVLWWDGRAWMKKSVKVQHFPQTAHRSSD